MKRFGTPFRLLATEAMFRITPLPRATMPGRNACMVRNIERTFRSNASAHSSSVASSSVPWCTKPAQLNRMSIAPGIARGLRDVVGTQHVEPRGA